MSTPCGILFVYIPFSNEVESVPYIYFIRIFEAPVTYHHQFIWISSFPDEQM